MARVRRKISAAEKRFPFGREENAHRPAAAAGRGLHERHVNFVHVGAFLAVHLDADEMFVEKFADVFLLERFAFHDVAPVAGRIADRKENRLLLALGLFKGFRAPGVPVHGVVGVLKQIRALFVGQAVCVHEVGAVFMVHRGAKRGQLPIPEAGIGSCPRFAAA